MNRKKIKALISATVVTVGIKATMPAVIVKADDTQKEAPETAENEDLEPSNNDEIVEDTNDSQDNQTGDTTTTTQNNGVVAVVNEDNKVDVIMNDNSSNTEEVTYSEALADDSSDTSEDNDDTNNTDLSTAESKAEAAVQLAENTADNTSSTSSQIRTYYNNAKNLVDALDDGTVKTNLSSRLVTVNDKLQEKINEEATNSVSSLESFDANTSTTSTEIKSQMADVNKLVDAVTDNSVRQGLTDRITVVETHITALEAVEKAQADETTANVSTARTLVNAITDSYYATRRESLIAILDNIVEDINKKEKEEKEAKVQEADDAIKAAENDPTEAKYNDALDKVKAIENFSDIDAKIDAFNVRLDVVWNKVLASKQLASKSDANYRLNAAEKNPSSESYEAAKKAVDEVGDLCGTTDDDYVKYLDRLENVRALVEKAQAEANAEAAVVKAEKEETEANYHDAYILVCGLEDEDVKNTLMQRLDQVSEDIESAKQVAIKIQASSAVTKAENTLLRSDYKDALNLVNQLNDKVSGKSTLLTRLNKVSELLDEKDNKAQAAVEKAQANETRDNYNAAKELVDDIDGALKPQLQTILDGVLADITAREKAELESKATTYVENAEAKKTRTTYNSAKTLVDSLEDGTVKTDLSNRLESVLAIIVEKEAETRAQSAVTKAQTSLSRTDYNTACGLVNALTNETVKSELSTKLDTVLSVIVANEKAAAENKAKTAVTKAESTDKRVDYETAKTLVTALDDGDVKTGLQDRLDTVLKVIKATEDKASNSVTEAESKVTRDSYNTAKTLVDKLDDGELKTGLLERLDVVLITIKQQERINAQSDAMAAVTSAEKEVTDGGTSQSVNTLYSTAKRLVDALEVVDDNDSTTKTSLQNRLAGVLDNIERLQAEEKAASAVQLSETNNSSRAYYNAASTLVEALGDGSVNVKTDLQSRLQAVLTTIETAETNATQAVEKAESDETRDNYNAAKELLAKIDGDTKTTLNARLAIVLQDIVNQENAEQAVTKAQSLLTRASYNNALTLIGALKDGDVKNNLNTTLVQVLNDIVDKENAATEAVTKAEGEETRDNYDAAKLLVDKIDGDVKTDLSQRLSVVLSDIVARENAAKAVDNAESSVKRSAYDSAKALVEALKDGQDKDDLAGRLDSVLSQVEANETAATNAVEEAETNKTRDNYEKAKELLDKIDGTLKTDLSSRLDKVLAVVITNEKAEAAVVTAENTPKRSNYENADKLVQALEDETLKTSLETRLQDVLLQVENVENDVKAKVTAAETNKTRENYNTALDALNNIDGDLKTELKSRLDKVLSDIVKSEKEEAARAAVKKLQADKTRENYNAAKTAVDALDDGDVKDGLSSMLNTLLATIEKQEAEDSVKTAESTMTRASYEAAKTLVDALSDGTIKTSYQNRLSKVLQAIEEKENEALAEQAVKKVETSKTREDYDAAEAIVDKLTNTDLKTSLENRLKPILEYIESNEKVNLIDYAKKAVAQAESDLLKSSYDKALGYVNKLEDGDLKTELTARLNKIQAQVEKLDKEIKATQAVEAVEKEETRDNYEIANELVKSLDDGDVKTELSERLARVLQDIDGAEKIQAITKASQAVTLAEEQPTGANYKAAKELVDALEDGAFKTSLLKRLEVIYPQVQENVKTENENNAKDAVDELEKNPTQDNLDDAKDKIDQIEDGKLKDELQNRIDQMIEQVEANNEALAKDAVTKSEKEQTRENYNAAKELVDKLTNDKVKLELSARLDVVLKEIEDAEKVAADLQAKAELIKKAQASVAQAEKEQTRENYNAAKNLVDTIENSDVKKELNRRLADVLTNIKASEVLGGNESMFDTADKQCQQPIDISKVIGETAQDKYTVSIDNTFKVTLPKDFVSADLVSGATELKLNCNTSNLTANTNLIDLLKQNNYESLGKLINLSLSVIKSDGSVNYITKFDKAIEITISFTDNDLAGFDKNLLKFLYYNTNSNSLENVDTYWDGNNAVLSTKHFSNFLLAQQDPKSNNNNDNNNNNNNGNNNNNTNNNNNNHNGNGINPASNIIININGNGSSSSNKGNNILSNLKFTANKEGSLSSMFGVKGRRTEDTSNPNTFAGLLLCSAAALFLTKKRN